MPQTKTMTSNCADLLNNPVMQIAHAGNQASLQDLGRANCAHLGISQSGVLDSWSSRILNMLVGNSPGSAVIEFAGNQFGFIANRECIIAIGSYSANIQINGQSSNHSLWRILPLNSGDHVTIIAKDWSVRHYIAVRFGFSGQQHYSSVSTDNLAKLGGNIHAEPGQHLKKGDSLFQAPGDVEGFSFPKSAHRISAVPLTMNLTLRCVIGPEYENLNASSQQELWSHRWRITSNSNRMGYRLCAVTESSGLGLSSDGQLASHAVMPGTIQLPASGQPHILLADAGTTGGYPRIATVIAADLWKLAHIPFEQTITLQSVSEQAAVSALRRQQIHLEKFQIACRAHFRSL